jgi:hypothetical protein
MRTDRTILMRRKQEAELQKYAEHVEKYRDLEFKVNFHNNKKTLSDPLKSVEEEKAILENRRSKLRELFEREDKNFMSFIEEKQLRAREEQERELEERAATLTREKEQEHQRIVNEKRLQQEELNSEGRRLEQAKAMREEHKRVLEVQLEEKRLKHLSERDESSMFNSLWQKECRKRESREVADLEAIKTRNEEMKRILKEQLESKSRETQQEPQTYTFPDNCFWNGTLKHEPRKVIRVPSTPQPSPVLNPKTDEGLEDARMVAQLVENERLRLEKEKEVRRIQKESLQFFFEQSMIEKQTKKEETKLVDNLVNEYCKKVSEAAAAREEGTRRRRIELQTRTVHELEGQISAKQEEMARKKQQKEEEREAQKKALEELERIKETERAMKLSKIESYKKSLIQQIQS